MKSMKPMKPMICLPTGSCSEKSLLDSSTHPHVDLALKHLKLVARRFSVALTGFEEESRLLERIFYKGKNQHGSALFWRRVQEMRRLCDRLRALHLHTSATQVRHAFYNSTDYHNQVILRSPWTHLPDIRTIKSMVQLFAPSRELLRKMSARFLDAYSSFKRAMQTGAFLQLVLTLSAIACRLRALTEVLFEAHGDLTSTLVNLCDALEALSAAQTLDVTPITLSGTAQKESSPGSPPSPISLAIGPSSPENAGNDQSFDEPEKPRGTKAKKQSSSMAKRERLPISLNSENSAMETALPKSSLRHGNPRAGQVSKTKARKKPTDEIDAIFGF